MAFEIKRDWPIAGAIALGGFGLLLASKGSSGPGYTVQQTSTGDADKVAQAYLAAQAQQQSSVAGAFSSYLDYLTRGHSIQASEYETYLQTVSAQYTANIQAKEAQDYLQAQQNEFYASQPSGWDKIGAWLLNAAQYVVPFIKRSPGAAAQPAYSYTP